MASAGRWDFVGGRNETWFGRGLAAIGMFALAGHSHAAVLTIDLDIYASAVDTTPGVLMATMTVTDVSGGWT
jgi:hypothetical protein